MNSSRIIKPFERERSILIPVEEANRQLEALLARQRQNPLPPPPGREAETKIQTTADFWTIEGVLYRGESHEVDLAKTWLDNGTARTQDAWIDYTREARGRNE